MMSCQFKKLKRFIKSNRKDQFIKKNQQQKSTSLFGLFATTLVKFNAFAKKIRYSLWLSTV